MGGTARVAVKRVDEGRAAAVLDSVAVEEPLEIRVGDKPVAITMRTPGEDGELAVGFLFGEGLLRRREDVAGCAAAGNVLRVEMAAGAPVELER